MSTENKYPMATVELTRAQLEDLGVNGIFSSRLAAQHALKYLDELEKARAELKELREEHLGTCQALHNVYLKSNEAYARHKEEIERLRAFVRAWDNCQTVTPNQCEKLSELMLCRKELGDL